MIFIMILNFFCNLISHKILFSLFLYASSELLSLLLPFRVKMDRISKTAHIIDDTMAENRSKVRLS